MINTVKIPKISVLLSTYNDEKYIKASVDSVLNQSFSDFEFVIIDDGSTDSTYDIISAIEDSRIVIFRKENTGLIDSLNFGISKCRGEYIARMDGDDICHADRLKLQFEFLSDNLNYSICGANTIYIDGQGERFGKTDFPISNDDIKLYMTFGSPISHPTLMIKRDVLAENRYSHDYPIAEDYELWARLRDRCLFHNIKKPLLYYRFYGDNISLSKRDIARGSRLRICRTYFNNIFDDDLLNDVFYSFILCDTAVSDSKYHDLVKQLLAKEEFKSSVFRRYTIVSWFLLSIQKRSVGMLIFNGIFARYPIDYIRAIFGYVNLFRLRIYLKKKKI